MRRSVSLKILLRTPLKTLLTFLLIAAASYALFSRAVDHAVTAREADRAEDFYHGVAALDNTVPPIQSDEGVIYPDDKPWPSAEKMAEFASLPGVTLVDERHMTAGLVEDYERLPVDRGHAPYHTGEFIVEGAYAGYEDDGGSRAILLDGAKALAGDFSLEPGEPLRIGMTLAEIYDAIGLSPSYFEGLEKGTRCLVMGSYDEETGNGLEMADWSEEPFLALEGGTDPAETETPAYWKGVIEAANLDRYTYDVAYTADMRAIPRFNERGMALDKGRLLTAGDEGVCVVSDLFLEKNHRAIGDKITIRLGDKLEHQDAWFGTRALVGKNVPDFVRTAELEIIGSYRFTDDFLDRDAESAWSYTSSTIFVPASLLPVEVPQDYEPVAGEFSVFVEDAGDIEAFQEAVGPLAAETGLGLRFSDGGFLNVKESFKTGRLAAFLTAALYGLGAALALLLAVGLYIGRNREAYAVMRMLGVPGRKAGNAVALPLCALSALAVLVGGTAGLAHASGAAAEAVAGMADGVPGDYVPDTALPVGSVVLCLVFALSVVALATLLFLRRMRNVPPLELLRENTWLAGRKKKAGEELAEISPVPAKIDVARLPAVHELPARRNYRAPRQVGAYVLRHMRRGMGRAAASLALAVVLAAGIGAFVLARAAYQDAFQKIEVKGRATDFSSSAVAALSKSELTEDVYCYSRLSVRVGGTGLENSMTLTNDMGRYLGDGCAVTYAKGYDGSVFEGTGAVCLLGRPLAEKLGVSPGGEITLLTGDLYAFLTDLYEDEAGLQAAAERAGKAYKVVGIVEAKDAEIGNGIFASVNDAAETLYGQPFPVGYCEFSLTDNMRIGELDALLEEQRAQGMEFAPTASFFVDRSGLENVRRVRDVLEALFPAAMAAAALIGLLGSGLSILQSGKEAAIWRILGSTKRRAWCAQVLEQTFLCIAGIAFAAGAFALRGMAGQSAQDAAGTLAACWLLYLLSCVCGAAAASARVAGGRILELLQARG